METECILRNISNESERDSSKGSGVVFTGYLNHFYHNALRGCASCECERSVLQGKVAVIGSREKSKRD